MTILGTVLTLSPDGMEQVRLDMDDLQAIARLEDRLAVLCNSQTSVCPFTRILQCFLISASVAMRMWEVGNSGEITEKCTAFHEPIFVNTCGLRTRWLRI